jgi:hypothetical protein
LSAGFDNFLRILANVGRNNYSTLPVNVGRDNFSKMRVAARRDNLSSMRAVVSGAAELHLLHLLIQRTLGACARADIKNEKARQCRARLRLQ